jgi:hypothetical protein
MVKKLGTYFPSLTGKGRTPGARTLVFFIASIPTLKLDWSNKKYVPKKRATIGSSKKRSKSMTAKQYDKLHGN